jgi:hypothetical protein
MLLSLSGHSVFSVIWQRKSRMTREGRQLWIPIIHLFPYNGGLSYKMADNIKGIFHQPQREKREKEGKKVATVT